MLDYSARLVCLSLTQISNNSSGRSQVDLAALRTLDCKCDQFFSSKSLSCWSLSSQTMGDAIDSSTVNSETRTMRMMTLKCACRLLVILPEKKSILVSLL